MATHEVVLEGCRPTPLAHYLKALGVFRLVSEQADPEARAAWRARGFAIWSKLDPASLQTFFLEAYEPTPILGPWNGGSGFYPKDNTSGIGPIEASTDERWRRYRESIRVARDVVARLGLNQKPEKDAKTKLLTLLRAAMPDDALSWMDAALLLTDAADRAPDGLSYSAQPKFPPLLGTGGNDGRLDFTNNFMQRLVEILPPGESPPQSTTSLLAQALFAEQGDGLRKGAAIGQFLPGNAGGANAESGFDAESLINPWDFVLMLEGAAMFAAAAVRRHEHDIVGAMSFPFTVHSVASGYGSATNVDEKDSRAEMWLPIWEAPADLRELTNVFAEGRARVARRSVRTGVDFARAVVGLGVDRGIVAFERMGFQVRNGLSYLAVPLGRIEVRHDVSLDPVGEIDGWLDTFRRAATDKNAPARALRALRGIENAILEVCQRPDDPDRMLDLFVALGQAESAMVTSLRWARDKRLQPIPRLDPRRWLERLPLASTTELRLGLSVASVRMRAKDQSSGRPIREQIEPVCGIRRVIWDDHVGRDVSWTDAEPVDGMIAVLRRRVLLASSAALGHYPDHGSVHATLVDVGAFIDGALDDARLAACIWSGALLNWTAKDLPSVPRPDTEPEIPSLYAISKLCFAGRRLDRFVLGSGSKETEIPIVPDIVRCAATGDPVRASELAIRRLRASGLAPAVGRIALGRGSDLSRRVAAALLFPLGRRDLRRLANQVLRQSDDVRDPTSEDTVPA